MFEELDIVELTEDLPGHKAGEQCVITTAFGDEAFDLEFEQHEDIDQMFAYSVKPNQIKMVRSFKDIQEATQGDYET